MILNATIAGFGDYWRFSAAAHTSKVNWNEMAEDIDLRMKFLA